MGERIPAFDALAITYGVAVNTVRKAIELLCIEGLLQSSRGRGTTVASTTAPTIDEPLRMAMYDPMTESDEFAIDVLKTETATLPQMLVQDYHRHGTILCHRLKNARIDPLFFERTGIHEAVYQEREGMDPSTCC